MYNISSFSKLSNTSVQTLRYYHTLGLLKPGHIGPDNNYRFYTKEELSKIRLIKKLKKMKFSLKEIAELFNNYDEKALIEQKRLLADDTKENFKNIKEIDKIIKLMKTNTNLNVAIKNLINKNERNDEIMKEEYLEAKKMLMNAYDSYKNDDFEVFVEKLEKLAIKIFPLEVEDVDPYWMGSARDFFLGIVVEIFKNNKEEDVNFKNIFRLRIGGQELKTNIKEYVENLDEDTYSYLNLYGVAFSPSDTRQSIISVFNLTLKKYAVFEAKK